MPYQRSQMLQMLMEQRMREKMADRELQEWFMKDAHQEQQRKEYQQVEDAQRAFGLATDVYNSAQTPAQKEAIVQRMQRMRGIWEKHSPIIAKAMDELLVGTPIEQQELKRRDWLKRNPEVKPPDFDPSLNPQNYAEKAWNRELWKKSYAKQVYGEDYMLPLHVDLGDDKVSYLDDQGKVTVTTWDILNKHYDEIGESVGVTGTYLQHSGGWLPPQSQQFSMYENGIEKRGLLETKFNAISGQTSTRFIQIGEGWAGGAGAGSGAGGSKPPVRPDDKVLRVMSYTAGNELPSKEKDPLIRANYNRIQDAFAEYDNDPTRAMGELNGVLREMDDRFTYIAVSNEDEQTFGKTIFGTKLKIGRGANIYAVPGRPVGLQTRDGVSIPVIMDEFSGNVYNSKGMRLGGLEQMQLISESTATDLGISQDDLKPAAQPKPPTAEEKIQEEIEQLESRLEKLQGSQKTAEPKLNERGASKVFSRGGVGDSITAMQFGTMKTEPTVKSTDTEIQNIEARILELKSLLKK